MQIMRSHGKELGMVSRRTTGDDMQAPATHGIGEIGFCPLMSV